MTNRVGEFVPSDRAEMGESTLPLELFLSSWNPKDVGVSRGTQWTGRDVKAKEIRQVQRSSIWDIIARGGNYVIEKAQGKSRYARYTRSHIHARDEMERILYKRTVDDKNHKKVVSTSCVYNKHVIIAITSKGVIRCLWQMSILYVWRGLVKMKMK